MRRCRRMVMLWALVAGTLSDELVSAAESHSTLATAEANAAVVYWQAFAVLPKLSEHEKAAYDAAVESAPGPVGADLQPIVARFDNALRALHRAQGMAECDWIIAYDEGPEGLLPHLQAARELARAALVRARMRFAAGDPDGAVSDILDVFHLARDCGRDSLIVSSLVGRAIESGAVDVLAAHLTGLTPGQLDATVTAITTLRRLPSVSDCVRSEGRMMGEWIEGVIDVSADRLDDPREGTAVFTAILKAIGQDGSGPVTPRTDLSIADVRDSLGILRADYSRMAEIADRPPAERDWNDFQEATMAKAPERFLSSLFLPAIAKVTETAGRHEARVTLLLLAIEAQRHGPDAIRNTVVPEHGPVEYRKTDGGFELRCQGGPKAEAEVLRVGAAK